MKKILGIDFGTKRIGLATGDDEAGFAFPLKTIDNNLKSVEDIQKLISEREIDMVVLGDPGDNEHVQETRKKIFAFKETLEQVGIEVVLQDESMTSLHSDLFGKKKPIARKWGGEQKIKKDESAAAMILQRYLDRKKYD